MGMTLVQHGAWDTRMASKAVNFDCVLIRRHDGFKFHGVEIGQQLFALQLPRPSCADQSWPPAAHAKCPLV